MVNKGKNKGGTGGGRVYSHCPKCRELNPLPGYFRIGERVKCARCGAEYVLSGSTAPGLVPKQRLMGLLGTLVVLAVVGYGLYLAWGRVWGRGAEPAVTKRAFSLEGGDVVYTYTVENRGARGLVELRPRYWTASGELVDASGIGREVIEMEAGEVLDRSGRVVVWGKEPPVGFRVECRAIGRL